MSKYSWYSLVIFRLKRLLNSLARRWEAHVFLKMSRNEADDLRKSIVSDRGKKVVDRKMKKHIKTYCRNVFGDSSYWRWLALYTEVRGGFVDGWMPDDYYRFKFLPRVNPEKFMAFSEEKTIDHKLFNGAIVNPIFFKSNGYYCNKEGTVLSKAEVEKLLLELECELIIKPADGHGGQRIFFRNSNELNLDDLPTEGNLLFQKVVQQHSELDSIHPHSINTFRVATFIDQKGIVSVKYGILRFAIGGTRVDNTSSGGGWVFIDQKGKVRLPAYENKWIDLGDRHPDTGVKFADLELAYFHKLISLCKNAHRRFPYTQLIGWDVFVDTCGEPKLLEWNANNPSFWKIEAWYGPFFADEIIE
jgi:hypothetical protein